MPSFEYQIIFCAKSNHLKHFRQQMSVFGDGYEGTMLLTQYDLVLVIVRGHPNHLAPTARHQLHAFDRSGIDATDRPVQDNASEYFDAWNFFPHDVGQRSRRLIVVLQDQPSHAARLRELRQIDGIDGTRRAIGRTVDMEINNAVQTDLPPR